MKEMIFSLLILSVCAVGFTACGKKAANHRSVPQLINLCRKDRANEAAAVAQLKKMGAEAQNELIRMLDKQNTPKESADKIFHILSVHFLSEESYQAVARFAARSTNPDEREILQKIQSMMKADLPETK